MRIYFRGLAKRAAPSGLLSLPALIGHAPPPAAETQGIASMVSARSPRLKLRGVRTPERSDHSPVAANRALEIRIGTTLFVIGTKSFGDSFWMRCVLRPYGLGRAIGAGRRIRKRFAGESSAGRTLFTRARRARAMRSQARDFIGMRDPA
jgi:hypothetical protein